MISIPPRTKYAARAMLAATLIVLGAVAPSHGQEPAYKLAKLDEAPPDGQIAAPIAGALAETGYRLTNADGKVIGDLWFCKTWDLVADFEPTGAVLYPFQEGQLIGALRFPEGGTDFRDQDIPRGVYTLRYLRQPVDGNHVGTAPTSDFVVMVKADQDRSLDRIDSMDLMVISAEASETGHPAVICLQAPAEKPESPPALSHNDDKDWWMGTFVGHGKAGDQEKETVLTMILIGHGAE